MKSDRTNRRMTSSMLFCVAVIIAAPSIGAGQAGDDDGTQAVKIIAVESIGAGQPDDDRWTRAMRTYLETPGSEADLNALASYVDALAAFDTRTVLAVHDQVDAILENGWTGEQPEVTRVIEELRGAIEAVRAGSRRPIVKYPHWSAITKNPIDAPLMDFLQAQMLVKVMLVEARRLEAEGDLDGAIKTYDETLTFATRLGAESYLISKLISRAAQDRILEVLERFLAGARLSEAQYSEIEGFLKGIEAESGSVREGLEAEAEVMEWTLTHLPASAEAASSDAERRIIEAVRGNEEEIMRQIGEMWATILEACSGSYADLLALDIDELTYGKHEILRMMIPNVSGARTRELITIAKARLTVIDTALRRHELTEGAPPPTLASLGLDARDVTDPFTGEPLHYSVDAGRVLLYSVGPDMTDDGGRTRYERGSGGSRSGDVIVRN